MNRAALLLVAIAGCGTAMTIRLENRGAPVTVDGVCGDARYEVALAPGEAVTWTPAANACNLDVGGAPAGRVLRVAHACQHDHGCALTVRAGAGSAHRAEGSGRLEIVGDVVTAAP